MSTSETPIQFTAKSPDSLRREIAALDLSFYQYDIDATGEITDDGEATLSFSQVVYGFVYLEGSVDATRVSRDISEYEGG